MKHDFADAIRAVKDGKKIHREGWNGKGQYIVLVNGIHCATLDGQLIEPEHDAIGNAALAFIGTSGVQVGWLASQADMLAEDWVIE